MADQTRLNAIEESITGFPEVLAQQGRLIAQNIQQLQVLTDSLIVIMKRFTDIDAKLDQLTESMKALESVSPSESSDKGKKLKNIARPPRLDFPRFDGAGPLGWIFKAEQFFNYYQTPEEHKLTLASFYMDGDALAWFQRAHKNTALVDWDDFKQVLTDKFGPSNVEDQHEPLSKSVHTGSLTEHQSSHSICTAECSSGEGCHFFHRPGGYNAIAQISNQENPASHPASRNPIAQSHISDGQTAMCNKFNTQCKIGENCHFVHHDERELDRPFFSGHETPMDPPMGGRNDTWGEPQCKIGENYHFAHHDERELDRTFCHETPMAPPMGGRNNDTWQKPQCKIGENWDFAQHDERELDRPFFSGHETPMASPMGGRNDTWQEPQAPPSLATFGASATAKISIDAWLAGPIIGKGGVNTKQVCRTTGAKLYIRDHESDPNLKNIELEGTFDQIKHATGMVEELIVNISSGMHAPANPAVGVGAGGGSPGYGFSSGHGPATSRNNFKTKICDKFANGFCSYGDRCNFAHGVEELRKFGAA